MLKKSESIGSQSVCVSHRPSSLRESTSTQRQTLWSCHSWRRAAHRHSSGRAYFVSPPVSTDSPCPGPVSDDISAALAETRGYYGDHRRAPRRSPEAWREHCHVGSRGTSACGILEIHVHLWTVDMDYFVEIADDPDIQDPLGRLSGSPQCPSRLVSPQVREDPDTGERFEFPPLSVTLPGVWRIELVSWFHRYPAFAAEVWQTLAVCNSARLRLARVARVLPWVQRPAASNPLLR